MIGIPQLDRLTNEQMHKILNRELRIVVKDPRKIQVTVEEEVPEPTLIDHDFMDQNTVDVLLKMELESRAGWVHVAEQIKRYQQNS